MNGFLVFLTLIGMLSMIFGGVFLVSLLISGWYKNVYATWDYQKTKRCHRSSCRKIVETVGDRCGFINFDRHNNRTYCSKHLDKRRHTIITKPDTLE